MTRAQSKKLIVAHINSRTPIMTQAVKEALQFNVREIEELEKTIEELEHQNKALMNRCRVLTRGELCIFCAMHDKCFEGETE